MGPGPPGLAPGMLGDGHQVPRRDVRHPRRRPGPGLPAPRERACPVHGGRRRLRPVLDAQRPGRHRRREDEQVAGQLAARGRDGHRRCGPPSCATTWARRTTGRTSSTPPEALDEAAAAYRRIEGFVIRAAETGRRSGGQPVPPRTRPPSRRVRRRAGRRPGRTAGAGRRARGGHATATPRWPPGTARARPSTSPRSGRCSACSGLDPLAEPWSAGGGDLRPARGRRRAGRPWPWSSARPPGPARTARRGRDQGRADRRRHRRRGHPARPALGARPVTGRGSPRRGPGGTSKSRQAARRAPAATATGVASRARARPRPRSCGPVTRRSAGRARPAARPAPAARMAPRRAVGRSARGWAGARPQARGAGTVGRDDRRAQRGARIAARPGAGARSARRAAAGRRRADQRGHRARRGPRYPGGRGRPRTNWTGSPAGRCTRASRCGSGRTRTRTPRTCSPRALRPGEQPLIVALDGVTDPRNLGAIVRSAAAFGGHGVLVPVRRSAGVTAGAWKASAGALARVPVAQAPNLARALAAYQEAGLFVVGLDAAAPDADRRAGAGRRPAGAGRRLRGPGPVPARRRALRCPGQDPDPPGHRVAERGRRRRRRALRGLPAAGDQRAGPPVARL